MFTILVLSFAVGLFVGLAVVPTMEETQAANILSESKNKGKQGEESSGRKRNGDGKGDRDP